MRRWLCDMDGVLVRQTGREGFDEMPWHKDGQAIWRAIERQRPTLLSKVPDARLALGYVEKRRWVDLHLGVGVPLIVVPDSLGKAPYCVQGDVLIDDSEPNCLAWSKVGGHAILHRRLEATLEAIMKAKQLRPREERGQVRDAS